MNIPDLEIYYSLKKELNDLADSIEKESPRQFSAAKNASSEIESGMHEIFGAAIRSAHGQLYKSKQLLKASIEGEKKMSDMKNIKEGDFVKLNSTKGYEFAKVERITKSQSIVGGIKFKKPDGLRVGGRCDFRSSISAISDEENQARKLVEAEALLKRVSQINPEALNFDELDTLRRILEDNSDFVG